MDGSSTLVLEGQVDSLPSLNVSDSATVDGQLVLHLSLPPTFSSYGVWQNYTIMSCGEQCQGKFQKIVVEPVGGCASTVDVQERRERDSLISIALAVRKLEICFASDFLPSLMFSGVILLLVLVQ